MNLYRPLKARRHIKSHIAVSIRIMLLIFLLHLQTIDDVLVCLVSMGFDLKDCQDAIHFGKITVEDAVEWYVY